MTIIAEQKRIVVRVEELLRRCDTLEAQLHQTRTLRTSSLPPSTASSSREQYCNALRHYRE